MKQRWIIAIIALIVSISGVQHASAAGLFDLGSQKHYYTIQLRSDNRTIVYGKVTFENNSDNDQASLSLTAPSGVQVDSFSAKQVLARSSTTRCTQYETYEQWRQRQSTTTVSPGMYDNSRRCMTPATDNYDDDFNYDNAMTSSTDYYMPSYYARSDPKYDYGEIKTEIKDGSHYTFTLSRPIKAHKQGAVLIAYTSKSYISNIFGNYTYHFRSWISDQKVDTTTVSVNFDDDLYSREATQQRTSEPTTSDLKIDHGVTANESRSLDTVQNTIGRGGRYIKTQGAMLPGDTFEIKGTYATSPVWLYGKEFLIGLIVLALIGVAIWRYRIWRELHPKRKPVSLSSDKSAGTRLPLGRYFSDNNTGDISLGRMIGLSASSIAGAAAAFVAILGIANLAGVDNSSMATGMVTVIGIFVTSLLLLVVAPFLYLMQCSPHCMFQWVMVHIVTIIIVVVLVLILLGNMAGPSYGGIRPVDCINC